MLSLKKLLMSSSRGKSVLELLPSYLAAIENSVDSNLFRKLYYRIDGDNVIDVLDDGDLSCAVFVSSILYLFKLIKERHTTVKSTVEDMGTMGWYKIKRPKRGAIILWGYKKKSDGTLGKHRHLGFYINPKVAISNSSPKRMVAKHHFTFGISSNGKPRRDILAYYWNDKLN